MHRRSYGRPPTTSAPSTHAPRRCRTGRAPRCRARRCGAAACPRPRACRGPMPSGVRSCCPRRPRRDRPAR
ncbi:hypothetical protein DEJ04_11405 [Curtobacterium sp. MCLR17_044]|nr:hypothetical protein DEJ04_11405 [Curtobacterium sp. MCLR17_044]